MYQDSVIFPFFGKTAQKQPHLNESSLSVDSFCPLIQTTFPQLIIVSLTGTFVSLFYSVFSLKCFCNLRRLSLFISREFERKCFVCSSDYGGEFLAPDIC